MTSMVSTEERKRILSHIIGVEVAKNGARVESHTDYQAVLVAGRRPNHLLHFLVSFLTVGLWVIPWIAMTLMGGEKRIVVYVDEFGTLMQL